MPPPTQELILHQDAAREPARAKVSSQHGPARPSRASTLRRFTGPHGEKSGKVRIWGAGRWALLLGPPTLREAKALGRRPKAWVGRSPLGTSLPAGEEPLPGASLRLLLPETESGGWVPLTGLGDSLSRPPGLPSLPKAPRRRAGGPFSGFLGACSVPGERTASRPPPAPPLCPHWGVKAERRWRLREVRRHVQGHSPGSGRVTTGNCQSAKVTLP